MTIKNAKDLVAEANAFVDALSADAALKLLAKKDAVFVNLREKDELEKSGKLKGAVHVPRGLLEFQADHASPSHVQAFDPAKHLVLFCGSGSRSALVAEPSGTWGLSAYRTSPAASRRSRRPADTLKAEHDRRIFLPLCLYAESDAANAPNKPRAG